MNVAVALSLRSFPTWLTLPKLDSRRGQVRNMPIEKETMKAMIRDFHGFEISDEELDMVAPALNGYLADVEMLRDLDLSDVMSGRLIHADEGGEK